MLQPLHHCDPVPTQIPIHSRKTTYSQAQKIKSEIQARFDEAHVTARYSQFGELLQVGQVLYVSDGVVLQEQMGEVGGKAQIAYV